MNLKLIRSDAHHQHRVSIICLFLLGASFVVGVPSLFASSLPAANAMPGAQLAISIAPSLILNNTNFHAYVSVQLLNPSNGFPLDSHRDAVQVVLTSNDTKVAKLPTLLYIPPGVSSATENLTAGGVIGNATITASAQGYLPTRSMVIARNTETTLSGHSLDGTGINDTIYPYFAPSKIANDNYTYPKMVVGELQTINEATGEHYPYVAQTNVTVWARSSDNSTMQVSTSPFTIVAGNSYAVFNLNSTFFPGPANITLQANDWNSYTTSFTSFGTASATNAGTPVFSVQYSITPSRVLPRQAFTVALTAQTVGAPVTSAGANLNWTTNTANETSADRVLNATGYASASFVASNHTGNELVQVLVSEGGIQSYLENVTVPVFLDNFSVAVINPHPAITTGYSTSLGLHVLFNETGVSNATIFWSAPNGTLTSPPLKTNATGYAFVTYVSGSVAGNQSVIATISKAGFANMTERVYYSVVHASPPPVQKQLSTNPLLIKVGNVIPVWVFIPIGGAAGGIGFFFFRRWRNGGGYGYDE